MSFALVQWERLQWQKPDLIVPIPLHQTAIAQGFALKLNIACTPLFRRRAWPIGSEKWLIRESLIEEDQSVLFFDVASSGRQLKLAAAGILESFPKSVRILSLSR